MIRSLPSEIEESEEGLTSTDDWRTVSEPIRAGWLFSQELLHRHKDSKRLFLSVDLGQDKQEQDHVIVTFYKRDGIQWTSPLECKLRGDVATGSGVDHHVVSTVISRLRSGFHLNLGGLAIIKIFEGEPDHLIPSVSKELLENDMFTMAGRMIGHSFFHGGPSFPGLSPAVIHILYGGLLETAPVTIRDCPDLDFRETLEMLDGDTELKECDSIHQLCLSWNLPAPDGANRKWLVKKLLLHAVIGETIQQINHFRKGLTDTGIWPLLIHRKDVIPILFPREAEAQVTPQMVLDCITWPLSVTVIFESYSDELKDQDTSCVTDVHRVSGYLKTFIKNATPAELKSLVKFWVGWEVPATEMKVEIVEAALPTASTCFEKLRLPRHYDTYKTFYHELCACISTCYTGFGCP